MVGTRFALDLLEEQSLPIRPEQRRGGPMRSLEGKLLAASPYVNNREFARSVVLVLRHDDQGAVGLILNRPLKDQAKPIWERLSGESFPSDLSINYGGPVSGPLLAIHQSKRLSQYQFSAGVYLSHDRSQVEQLLEDSHDPFRLYLGHAGWKPGQLEFELKQGNWMAATASPLHVFNDDEELWSNVVRQIGRSIIQASPGVKHLPEDPTLN